MAEHDESLREVGHARAQRERYDHLAAWTWRVLSNDGKDRPGLQTEGMLREQMVNRRVITADGEMRVDRMEKFIAEKARIRGKRTPNLPHSEDAWDNILEGRSP